MDAFLSLRQIFLFFCYFLIWSILQFFQSPVWLFWSTFLNIMTIMLERVSHFSLPMLTSCIHHPTTKYQGSDPRHAICVDLAIVRLAWGRCRVTPRLLSPKSKTKKKFIFPRALWGRSHSRDQIPASRPCNASARCMVCPHLRFQHAPLSYIRSWGPNLVKKRSAKGVKAGPKKFQHFCLAREKVGRPCFLPDFWLIWHWSVL